MATVAELTERTDFIKDALSSVPLARVKKTFGSEASAGTIARAYHQVIAQEQEKENDMQKNSTPATDPLIGDVGTPVPTDDYFDDAPNWATGTDPEPSSTAGSDVPLSEDIALAAVIVPEVMLAPPKKVALAPKSVPASMTAKVARTKTDQIKQGKTLTRFLLLEIHETLGWKSLGYRSFQDYLNNEFEDDTDRITYHRWVTHARIQLALSGITLKDLLQNVTSGKVAEEGLIPVSQAQALLLSRLPAKQIEQAYKEASASSPDPKLLTKRIEEIVGKKLATKSGEETKSSQTSIDALDGVNTPETAVKGVSEPTATVSPAPLSIGKGKVVQSGVTVFARYYPTDMELVGEFLVLETEFTDDYGERVAIIVPTSTLKELLVSSDE